MPVTLKDIAERTGVSPSVVSTVLSGRDNGTFVSDSTRRKVLQVAETLNHTPVRAGRLVYVAPVNALGTSRPFTRR